MSQTSCVFSTTEMQVKVLRAGEPGLANPTINTSSAHSEFLMMIVATIFLVAAVAVRMAVVTQQSFQSHMEDKENKSSQPNNSLQNAINNHLRSNDNWHSTLQCVQ